MVIFKKATRILHNTNFQKGKSVLPSSYILNLILELTEYDSFKF